MTALVKEKNTKNQRSRWIGSVTLPGKDGEIFYAGATIAVVNGKWQNVTATTGLEGRYAEVMDTVDNTTGGKAVTGRFYNENGKWLTPLRNDTVAPITSTELGEEVYWDDNQTVTIDDTGRSISGRAWKFGQKGTFNDDTSIVWVEVY